MEDNHKIEYFRKTLQSWFKENRRQFPWREEVVDNYRLILSEVLLQRTKAETVARYYPVFFSKYPDWKALGEASIEDLQEIMKPLGLHTQRANRLFKLAQGMKERGFDIELKSNELHESGFTGLYIQNAYELFILQKKRALLDVNMSRLLKRFFEPGVFIDVRRDKELQEIASRVIHVKDCKELNWAILDYAAAVCTSRKPSCSTCKLRKKCKMYNEKMIS